MERFAPQMELNGTQEIIVALKAVKEKQKLSIPQIKDMVDATGAYLSMTTLRRVFADGSESEDSFSYENTLRPISQALLIDNETDDSTRARVELYEAVINHKDEVIEGLRAQLEALRSDHDNRCKECEGRMDFLMHQIELKDRRMERKDEIINRLLAKVL